MAQLNNPIPFTKLAVCAGAGILVAAIFCANLLFSRDDVTHLDAKAMSLVTSHGAFKTVRGDGLREIHVFLSADCSFCRKIEPELDRLENVTVYRHMLPGHTEAGRLVAVEIWCAEDQAQAWKAVAAGQQISPAKCDGSVIDKNLALASKLGLTMTPSIVYGDGQVSAGMLSVSEISARIAISDKG